MHINVINKLISNVLNNWWNNCNSELFISSDVGQFSVMLNGEPVPTHWFVWPRYRHC